MERCEGACDWDRALLLRVVCVCVCVCWVCVCACVCTLHMCGVQHVLYYLGVGMRLSQWHSSKQHMAQAGRGCCEGV